MINNHIGFLLTILCLSVIFLLVIVLSVLRLTASDYSFDVSKRTQQYLIMCALRLLGSIQYSGTN